MRLSFYLRYYFINYIASIFPMRFIKLRYKELLTQAMQSYFLC